MIHTGCTVATQITSSENKIKLCNIFFQKGILPPNMTHTSWHFSNRSLPIINLIIHLCQIKITKVNLEEQQRSSDQEITFAEKTGEKNNIIEYKHIKTQLTIGKINYNDQHIHVVTIITSVFEIWSTPKSSRAAGKPNFAVCLDNQTMKETNERMMGYVRNWEHETEIINYAENNGEESGTSNGGEWR